MGQFGIDYGMISDVGGKTSGNEDSAFFQQFDMIFAPGSMNSKSFSQRVILALVADGVSGSVKGEEASTFVVKNLASKIINHILLNNVEMGEIQQTLVNTISQVNEQLLKKFEVEIAKAKIPKTTLVGMLIIGQYLWCFNIGDSRGFLIRDGVIGQISVDDVGTASHEITQAFGEPKVNPHIFPYLWAFNENDCKTKSFNQNYYFLICSDGLTDKVSSDEIKNILSEDPIKIKLQEKVQKLYDLTMNRGIEDNVSIIAVDLANYFQNISKVQIIRLKPRV